MKKQIKHSKCEKCEEYLSLAKRSRADYENLKKEIEKWKLDLAKFANENLIYDFIPVLDHFTEAMTHVPEDQAQKDWVIGITYIKKQIEDVLKNNGVEIYGEVGAQFDPHLYEAVSEIKKKDIESGKIVKVIRRGYKIGERVVRAGQVVIAK